MAGNHADSLSGRARDFHRPHFIGKLSKEHLCDPVICLPDSQNLIEMSILLHSTHCGRIELSLLNDYDVRLNLALDSAASKPLGYCLLSNLGGLNEE